MQFGIDFACWATGPKFMGVNRIPPGSHFIYYSSGTGDYSDRTGFWTLLKPRQVIVRKWDTDTELLVTLSEDEEFRYADGVAHHDFDHNLGPYSLEHYNNWLELVRHVSQQTIHRVEPVVKNVTMKSMEYTATDELDGVEPFHSESNTLFFTTIPDVSRTRGKRLQGAELSMRYLDSSDTLEALLKKRTWQEVLGELEMAYVIFVLGQNYDGFEQWKQLVLLLSGCQRAVEEHTELFADFIRTLFNHLQQAPEDFFQDDLSAGNFLTRALTDLLEVASESACKTIRQRAGHLAALVQKRFGCDWHELDVDRPVIVECEHPEESMLCMD